MSYPNTTSSVIVIAQTSASASAINGQYPFIERYISGSNLILQTDDTGALIGSNNINASLLGTSSWAITASKSVSSSYADTSSYVITNGIPSGGTTAFVLSKKTDASYDTEWIPNSNFIFTSSYFLRPTSSQTSQITCSSDYAYWHLHTSNDLNVYIGSSVSQSSFTIRLVSSGSRINKVTFSPYQDIQWVGTAGFGSSSIEDLGIIAMSSGQEILLTFVYYNVNSPIYSEKKYAGIVTDLNTPGLENKTIVSNLYIVGEGDIGISGDQLNNPNAFVATICGGGTGPDDFGITNKTFWGWMPLNLEGQGRKYIPLYE